MLYLFVGCNENPPLEAYSVDFIWKLTTTLRMTYKSYKNF